MRFFSALLAVAPLSALAAPARFVGRQAADPNAILVFTFADVLEQLELEFYKQAVAKFGPETFIEAGFSTATIPAQLFEAIQRDETAHSEALQASLRAFGAEPLTTCQFNFDPVLGDVSTVLAAARLVEDVGVGAYLGATTLLQDPVLLTAAGSILTIEARHQTMLNIMSGSGSAIPQAFDIALTPQEVLALAGPFIDPASPCDLGVEAQTPLTITNTGAVGPGTPLTFAADTIDGTIPEESLFCNMIVGGAPFAISLPLAHCVVPEGINGPVAIWITNDAQPLINNVRDRDVISQVAGPTIAFIDISPETLGQLVRTVDNVDGTTNVEVITPEQAADIIDTTEGAPATGPPATEGATAPESADIPATMNQLTGPSEDGSITVNGWTMAPAGEGDAAAPSTADSESTAVESAEPPVSSEAAALEVAAE